MKAAVGTEQKQCSVKVYVQFESVQCKKGFPTVVAALIYRLYDYTGIHRAESVRFRKPKIKSGKPLCAKVNQTRQ